jgi:hypothetical protein
VRRETIDAPDERRNRLVNSEIISVMNAGEKKKKCAYYFFLSARSLRSAGHQLRAGLETILKSSNLPLLPLCLANIIQSTEWIS